MKIRSDIAKLAERIANENQWDELLARQKAINDAHDKVVDLPRSEYKERLGVPSSTDIG